MTKKNYQPNPAPVIEDEPRFMRAKRLGTHIEDRIVELAVHWDERTTITLRDAEPANDGRDDEARFRAMADRLGRIAEIIANAPAMVNELYERDLADQETDG